MRSLSSVNLGLRALLNVGVRHLDAASCMWVLQLRRSMLSFVILPLLALARINRYRYLCRFFMPSHRQGKCFGGQRGALTSGFPDVGDNSCGRLMLYRAHALLTQYTIPSRPLSPGLLTGSCGQAT